MSHLFNEILVNINSFGTFQTIITLVFFILTFIIFSFFFPHVVLVRYSLLFQSMMLLYLTIFLVISNTTNPDVTFHASRLLYAVFMLHSIVSVLIASRITKNRMLIAKTFSIISSILIIFLIYINETWMISRQIIKTTYYSALKGPLFPITLVYIFILSIILIIYFINLTIKSPEKSMLYWPIYVGIIFFCLFTDMIGIALLVNPMVKPPLYVSTLVFLILFLVSIFKEVRKSMDERDKMNKAYLYDDLTEVHTRNFILEEINNAINTRFIMNHYIAMIDIDGFKKVNDTYGHLTGDKVLAGLGKLLNELDTECCIPGRLGGDEFLLFFKGCNKKKVMKSLNDLLNQYAFMLTEMHLDIFSIAAGLSIGLIDINANMTLKNILTLADQTMYEAKKNGKNSIKILSHLSVS